ncbi:response regulator transcription factor [Streptomyces nodosus]|uniref:response regulator transcription factor n=1 Tax=Streptomyces nodosus TaxID=40318 RepID=UPI0036E6F018
MINALTLRQHLADAADELDLPLTVRDINQLAARTTARLAASTAPAHMPEMGISKRGYDVLVGIALGEGSPETARRLHLGTDTVKTHKRRLYKVLDARTAAHAVAIATRRGILRAVETGGQS